MQKPLLLTVVVAFSLLSVIVSVLVGPAAHAQLAVFQAAGPDAASIQGTVDAYRAALGGP
jgi:hypothetical protein